VDLCKSRDNNFNLIRMVAALMVMASHCAPLSLGVGAVEPLQSELGMTLGSVAVDIFFVTSGFLVTASLLHNKDALQFVWNRVLRIYPALWIMVAITVFGMGLSVTTLDGAAYLSSPQVSRYLWMCATMFDEGAYFLPGVFMQNPYSGAINGSLWSVAYELKMYAILVVAWLLLRWAWPRQDRVIDAAIVLAVVASGFVVWQGLGRPEQRIFAHLFFMFFSGAACYVLRRRISLTTKEFLLWCLAIAAAGVVGSGVFRLVYTLTLAYGVLYLAYVPAGWIRNYNLLGDYSYGVYIYAFPVQQIVASVVHGVSASTMFFASLPFVLVLAVASWHGVEKRALALKSWIRPCADRLRPCVGWRFGAGRTASPDASAAERLR
jgi:peptidoglycan/LPS O-acetylase OafA/YrhL